MLDDHRLAAALRSRCCFNLRVLCFRQSSCHTNCPVPVYYEGEALNLRQYIGRGFQQYGVSVPGLPGHVDQSQIYQAMLSAIKDPLN
ncbi:MAG: hypothetical protein RBJ76_07655 [Stenomitos frigidus ULC029]